MSAPPAVRVRGAGKHYPSLTRRGKLQSLKGALLHGELWRRQRSSSGFMALADIDLEVARGETVAVIGPNGSGKSTLLKLVSGILRPTTGTVEVAGRATALIELGAGFHPEITGRENAIINGMMLGMSRGEVMARLDDIIEFSGIGPFIDQPVKTYSSGMYVRLGFAVAVAPEPEVLVVDEILAVGDEVFAHKCLDRITSLQRNGTAILLVSHDLGLVEAMAQRALYLREGRTVYLGTARAAVSRYRADVASEEAGQGQAKASAKRWGNQAVVLDAVDMLDAAGAPVQAIRSGEPATLRIAYTVHEPQDDFVFGMALHRDDGTHVYGTNTDIEGWRPERLDGRGEMRLEFPSLELAPGRYLIDAAVHTSKGMAFDYACEVCSFVVTSPVVWPGCYAPRHRWRPDGPVMQPPASE
jgi:ABC-type polysaccharide/polyol phosphate transport system ATPase subunit